MKKKKRPSIPSVPFDKCNNNQQSSPDESNSSCSCPSSPTRSSSIEIREELVIPSHTRHVKIKSVKEDVKLTKLNPIGIKSL